MRFTLRLRSMAKVVTAKTVEKVFHHNTFVMKRVRELKARYTLGEAIEHGRLIAQMGNRKFIIEW